MGNQSASLPHAGSSAHKHVSQVIVLVGFMGAGKTTVGEELARLLAWSFEDLDDRIQSREGRTIEEIFRDSGEPEFRRFEHMALRELLCEAKSEHSVIALGGGTFAEARNVSMLQDMNVPSVFLDAPVEELFRRCRQQRLNRPLRQGEANFRKLYETRLPLYMSATYHIETDGKPIEQIAAEIVRIVGISPSK
ncbi:MAG: shikimate kinase [Terriglobales bacterium]